MIGLQKVFKEMWNQFMILNVCKYWLSNKHNLIQQSKIFDWYCFDRVFSLNNECTHNRLFIIGMCNVQL